MLMMPIEINQVDIEAQVSFTPQVCEYQVIVQGQRRSLETLMQCTPRGSAFTLNQPNDRTAAWALLAELARLVPNWDAYGGEPIGGACVANARALLDALPPDIPSPEVTPNPNGTLTLDWETEDQALSLELGATRFSSFWESRHGIKTDDGALGQGVPDFAARALSALFPSLAPPPSRYERLMIDAQGIPGFTAAGCVG